MEPAEIAHRVLEQVRRGRSRRRAYGWEAFAVGRGPLPVVAGLREAFRAGLTDALRAAIEASTEALLSGRFLALGVEWPRRDPAELFPASAWTLDPVTGLHWPGADRFCFDVPYRHERRLGDVKYVWEFGRLQHLQPLAAAFALGREPRALAAIEAALRSWHAANPPFRGLAWNSGIELAMRAVSLLVVASLCGEALEPAGRATLRESLAAHLYWLGRYPSRFSSANNHAVAEHMAEALVAGAMPDLPGAAEVRDRARAGLEREAAAQILEDGAPAEQSPTYGAFTAEMLLLAAFAARAEGRPLAPVVSARLAAFADYVGVIAGPDGRVPAFGDDDEGRVLTLAGRQEETYPASVASAIAGFLGAPSSVPDRSAPELRDAVLGRPTFRTEPARGLRTFWNGGITVVREERGGRLVHLAIDHGPLGYLSIAAHGHADAGALVLSIDGEPVLVDPGTYLYHSGGPWRDWFRGTRAHSTLALADADQSVISGPFNWSHKASARLETIAPGEAWSLTVGHDGYRRRLGVDHRRTVSATRDGFAILDRLDPPGRAVDAELVLQFAPTVTLRPEGSGWRAMTESGPALVVAIEGAGGARTAHGEEAHDGGWVSPAFGLKVPATRLSWRGRVPDGGLRTSLTLVGRGAAP